MSERTQKINVYAIRRAILTALYEYQNPQSFGTLLVNHALLLAVAGSRLQLTNEDIQDIRMEWNYLLSKAYLVAIEGYDDYAKRANGKKPAAYPQALADARLFKTLAEYFSSQFRILC